MWPFRRRPRTDEEHGTEPAPDALGPVVPDRPAHAEWRDLAPIQRVSTGAELTTNPRRFTSQLVSWHSPAMLEPLGHYVTADAPVGVIDFGAGSDIQADVPETEKTEAPEPRVQRFAPRVDPGTATIAPATTPATRPAPDRAAHETAAPPAPDGPARATAEPPVPDPRPTLAPGDETAIEWRTEPIGGQSVMPTPPVRDDPPVVIHEWTVQPELADRDETTTDSGPDLAPAARHAVDATEPLAPEVTSDRPITEPMLGHAPPSPPPPPTESVPRQPQPERRIGLGLPVSRSASGTVERAVRSDTRGPRSRLGLPDTAAMSVQREPAGSVPDSSTAAAAGATLDATRSTDQPVLQATDADRAEPALDAVDAPPRPLVGGAPEPEQTGDVADAVPPPLPAVVAMRTVELPADVPVSDPSSVVTHDEPDVPRGRIPPSLPDLPDEPVERPTLGGRDAPVPAYVEPGVADTTSPTPSPPTPLVSRRASEVDDDTVRDPDGHLSVPLISGVTLGIDQRPTLGLDPDRPSPSWVAPDEAPPAETEPVHATPGVEPRDVPPLAVDVRPPDQGPSLSTQLETAAPAPSPLMSSTPTLGAGTLPPWTVQRAPTSHTEAITRAPDNIAVFGPVDPPSSRILPGVQAESATHSATRSLTTDSVAQPARVDHADLRHPRHAEHTTAEPFVVSRSVVAAPTAGPPAGGGASIPVVFRLPDTAPAPPRDTGVDRPTSTADNDWSSRGDDDWPAGDSGAAFANPDLAIQLLDAATVAQTAPMAGGGAPGGAPGGGASGDLDELARRLYSRIRIHLRNELRLDRERAGALVETRR